MPKQSEIKQEELQEFWEWCGFTQNKQNYGRGSEYLWNYPDAQVGTLPSLDLNNLFKYAVPKLGLMVSDLGYISFQGWLDYRVEINYKLYTKVGWYKGIGEGDDPALALYQAIQKARSRRNG